MDRLCRDKHLIHIVYDTGFSLKLYCNLVLKLYLVILWRKYVRSGYYAVAKVFWVVGATVIVMLTLASTTNMAMCQN